MSSIHRNPAVHRTNVSKLATNLLEIDDESYLNFLNPDNDIRQLFDYSKPTSRIGRDHEDQVKFVAEKLQANPALVAKVRIFIYNARLQKTEEDFRKAEEDFRNAEYYL
jgi:hypothetical protein